MERREELIAGLAGFSAEKAREAVPVDRRREALRLFARLLAASRDEIYAALAADLNRNSLDSLISELLPLIQIARL